MNPISDRYLNPSDIFPLSIDINQPDALKVLIDQLNDVTDKMLKVRNTRLTHFSSIGPYVDHVFEGKPVDISLYKDGGVFTIYRNYSFDSDECEGEVGRLNTWISIMVSDGKMTIHSIKVDIGGRCKQGKVKCLKYNFRHWLTINYFYGELNEVVAHIRSMPNWKVGLYMQAKYIIDRPRALAVGAVMDDNPVLTHFENPHKQ